MYRLKAVLVVALVVAALTGSVFYLSNDAAYLTSNVIEADHARLQDSLKEKLTNAESSIAVQANELSHDPTLVSELVSVREKLQNNSPDDLKKNTNNTWNSPVFDRVLDWKKKRDSEIKQHESQLSNTMQADSGSMLTQKPQLYWWNRSPELVLAFASVPMKDGSISSTLIAQGAEGKQLQAGKRYDNDIAILATVNQSQTQMFGHFVWDKKMYLAVVSPVLDNNTIVGSVVVGMELSKDFISTFSKAMPSYVDLLFFYSNPKPGDVSKDASQRIIYAANDNTKKTIESGQFHVNTNKLAPNAATINYDNLQPNIVYTGTSGETQNYAVSRLRWTWDNTQETDVYVVSNSNAANQSVDKFKSNILIAGIIALIAGIVLIFLVINAILSKMARIRKAFSDAINSGDPIDQNALAFLLDENPENLAQFTIKQIDSNDDTEGWDNLMMDFADEANAKADEALAPEEKASLSQTADVEEAKSIYEEYMRLRKENNINTPMDFDCFLRRLQRNAAKIKAQYHCQNVTFQVHVSNGNVLLKPKISKK